MIHEVRIDWSRELNTQVMYIFLTPQERKNKLKFKNPVRKNLDQDLLSKVRDILYYDKIKIEATKLKDELSPTEHNSFVDIIYDKCKDALGV